MTPSELTRTLRVRAAVVSGHLGRKAGRGFYEYAT